ncbi:MAG: hypothetical protein LBL28_02915, partial [Treponema sp.]|nr:hypothetical protein [Treponema sp.]
MSAGRVLLQSGKQPLPGLLLLRPRKIRGLFVCIASMLPSPHEQAGPAGGYTSFVDGGHLGLRF